MGTRETIFDNRNVLQKDDPEMGWCRLEIMWIWNFSLFLIDQLHCDTYAHSTAELKHYYPGIQVVAYPQQVQNV
jgi:hypothetical protein